MKERNHTVTEIFGPTVQGEGLLSGAIVNFVRFGYCDYLCSWCDSLFSVVPEEVKANSEMLTDQQILERLQSLSGSASWLVFSGGNPALQHLEGLVDLLHDNGYKITIETQGTIFREWIKRVDAITVSPKPPSSGNETTMADVDSFRSKLETITPDHSAGLAKFRERSTKLSYKVVIFDYYDFIYLRQLVRHLNDEYPIFASVGNNVGQDGPLDLINRWRDIAEQVMRDDEMGSVRVLPQGHVLLYGNQRGK